MNQSNKVTIIFNFVSFRLVKKNMMPLVIFLVALHLFAEIGGCKYVKKQVPNHNHCLKRASVIVAAKTGP